MISRLIQSEDATIKAAPSIQANIAATRTSLSAAFQAEASLMEGDTPETEFQPGGICTQSGVYQVIHHAHRLPHKVVISKGDSFPLCQKCGEAVRFWLITKSGTEATGSGEEARKRGAGESS